MEAAVRWSPYSWGGRQRFLLVDIADPSLTLNQIDAVDKSSIKYHAVTRCGKLPSFNAFAWCPVEESTVALGLSSGNASLVRLREDKQTSEVVATFKIKQQRKCNSVAFSTQRWLAVALDKTRSDICLNIYDATGELSNNQEPVRRLCAAELVSSVRFFESQPSELVAAVQRAYIRLYDLRDGFTSTGGNLQVSTRNVNNIAIDPLDENYFASGGSTDEPCVTVWDKRWIAQSRSSSANNGAVFNFAPAVDNSARTSVWSLRYSGRRRGRLAVCSSTGELRVVDMIEGGSSSPTASEYLPHNPYGGSAWSSNHYVSRSQSLEYPYHSGRYGRESSSRIIAFDWMSGEAGECREHSIITLRPSREIGLLRVLTATTQADITARHDLGINLKDLSITEARALHPNAHQTSVPYERASKPVSVKAFGPIETQEGIEDDTDAEVIAIRCARDSPQVSKILASSMTQRERCRQGYLFDCHKNMNIVAGNWQLERLWEIVDRFREQAANDAMVYKSLDLSYIGVAGLWSEQVGSNANRTLSPSLTTVSEAVLGLYTAKDTPAFEGERTDFPELRQACLAVCGWKFTTDTLEAECQELIDRGLHYQAIVQAVLHDYKHIALNLLRTLIRSKTVLNTGLGALLASDRINDEQREMCLWMAADTDDPALKALLTFLATGDWRDVMKTNYLHLGYRIALGMKYLNDTELSGFIQSETARAIKNGDLEGTLLTGLSEQAMELFQTYITKTNDLQTAVLAMAFTNPRYVDDVRWDMWRETYFMQMQSWQAFNERTLFIVKHSQLSRTRDGKSMIEPPAKQVHLRCNHCQAALERRGGLLIYRSSTGSGNGEGTRVAGLAANAGTVCPQCGRHMPRCGICAMWLGTPDPSKRGSAKQSGQLENIMAKFLSFCVACDHGFHADHAQAWFEKHRICPVPDCSCACSIK